MPPALPGGWLPHVVGAAGLAGAATQEGLAAHRWALAAVFAAFIAHPILHIEPSIVALLALLYFTTPSLPW